MRKFPFLSLEGEDERGLTAGSVRLHQWQICLQRPAGSIPFLNFFNAQRVELLWSTDNV